MTLAETIVALGLVALAALAVIGVFSTLMLSSTKTADQAAGELLCKSVMEKAKREGPDNWGLADPSALGARQTADIETADRSSTTRFYYQLEVSPLSNHAMGTLFLVMATVSWASDGSLTSQPGVGQLWLQKSEVVYIER
jgi:type II secretory pathway pseudopilin PulG